MYNSFIGWLDKYFYNRYVFGAMFLGVCLHLAPLFYSHADQEVCQFGTDSTALYERMRVEAKLYLKKNTKVKLIGYHGNGPKKFSQGITEQLKEFAFSRNNQTERYAAMHALLRQYGMEFSRNLSGGRFASKNPEGVLAQYAILLPKLNWFCPTCYIFKNAFIEVRTTKNTAFKAILYRRDLTLKSHHINHDVTFIKKRYYQICPRVLGGA